MLVLSCPLRIPPTTTPRFTPDEVEEEEKVNPQKRGTYFSMRDGYIFSTNPTDRIISFFFRKKKDKVTRGQVALLSRFILFEFIACIIW